MHTVSIVLDHCLHYPATHLIGCVDSGQYVGGILGPMVIYGPEDEAYDIDIGPILLQDWYHEDYFEIVKRVLAPSPVVEISLRTICLIYLQGAVLIREPDSYRALERKHCDKWQNGLPSRPKLHLLIQS